MPLSATSESPGLMRVIFLFLLLSLCLATPRLHAQCTPTSWVLTGTVTDSAGVGIAGVDIDVTNLATGLQVNLSQDFTLFDGSFSLVICQVVPSGFYDIRFQPPASEPFFDLVLQTVSLSGSGDLGSIVLEDAGIIEGRVVDETGLPLPFVDLDFFDPISGQATVFSGDFSDDLGLFQVKVTPAFWDVRFSATASTSTSALVPVLLSDVAIFDSVDIGDVILRDGYILSGTVLNSGGSVVVDADIDVRDVITGDKILTPGDNTNGAGVFNVLAPAGDWQLEIDPPQGSQLVSSLTLFNLPLGGTNLGSLVLEDGFSVVGTVVNSTGQVVPETDLDFIISATQIEIPTAHDNANSSGDFSVQVVPDTYDIAFRPRFVSGLAPLVVPAVVVAANTDMGNVTLPDGFALTGTVVAGLTPVSEVEITLTESGSGVAMYLFGNDSDGLGTFALRQVPGIYDVTATPLAGSGFNPVVVPGVDLNSDVNLAIDLLGGGPPTPPDPVTNLVCDLVTGSADLTWSLGNPDYDQIQVSRAGVVLANLPGTVTSFIESNAPQEVLEYSVVAIRSSLSSPPTQCLLDNTPPPAPPAAVINLDCQQDPQGVMMVWQLGDPDYDLIQVTRNGSFLTNLSGTLVSFLDVQPPATMLEYSYVAIRNGLESVPTTCLFDNTPLPGLPDPITGLTCVAQGTAVEMNWVNGEPDYDFIELYRDGALLTTIAGTFESFTDTGVATGQHEYILQAWRSGEGTVPVSCNVFINPVTGIFIRGDGNEDDLVNLGDAISVLSYLFVGLAGPECLDRLDSNDSGNVNIADAIHVLGYLFSNGPAPAMPFPQAGQDPTGDSLPCP